MGRDVWCISHGLWVHQAMLARSLVIHHVPRIDPPHQLISAVHQLFFRFHLNSLGKKKIPRFARERDAPVLARAHAGVAWSGKEEEREREGGRRNAEKKKDEVVVLRVAADAWSYGKSSRTTGWGRRRLRFEPFLFFSFGFGFVRGLSPILLFFGQTKVWFGVAGK